MTNLGHPIKQNISYCVPALEGNTLKLSENKTLSQHKESQPLYVKLNKYFCSSAAPALVGSGVSLSWEDHISGMGGY